MTQMIDSIGRLEPQRALKLFADWTDRIAAGEVPARSRRGRRAWSATSWSRSGTGPAHGLPARRDRHRQAQSDGQCQRARSTARPRRARIYVPILDPVNHTATQVKMPVRDPNTPLVAAEPDGAVAVLGRGAHLGQPDQRAQPDDGPQGPVWSRRASARRTIRRSARRARTIRRPSCSPLEQSDRQLSMYDPKTGKFTLIDTCFPTHHLIFAEDANHTLWTSAAAASGVVGWLNPKMFDETGDEAKSQGWTALILDTNGNGKRDDYVEPDQPVDPDQGQADRGGLLRRRRNPVDGSVWGIGAGLPRLRRARSIRARIRRRRRWRKSTSRPMPGLRAARHATSTATASSGRRWRADTSRASTGASARGRSTDRTATGQHCPEGWTLYPFPGPQFEGRDRLGQRRSQLLQLGRSVRHVRAGQERADRHRQRQRFAAGAWRTASWSICACPIRWASTPRGWTAASTIRRPAGRARACGRPTRTRTPFHTEGGKGTTSKVVKFQLRPDPLAN